MKRVFIGIIVAIVFGVYPGFAQKGPGSERTVSPPQLDSIPQIEPAAKSTALLGIPSTLSAVQYRRCPIDGQRLKQGVPAIFEGKAYRLCGTSCREKFWENPQWVLPNLKNSREAPLIIANTDGMCFCCEKPASREFCRMYRSTITFFCSSACSAKETRTHRTSVSRPKVRLEK